jgi:hypothetical protein
MDNTGKSPLAGVPECVIDAVNRALTRLSGIERERAGYKRIGLGDRFDADLDAAGAAAMETLAEFASHAPANGVDGHSAIRHCAAVLGAPVPLPYRVTA